MEKEIFRLGQEFQLFRPNSKIESFRLDRVQLFTPPLESLFILETGVLPNFPMAAWAEPRKKDPLAVNPFGEGYNITNEDLSFETRFKKLKDTANIQKRDEELALTIEIVGLLHHHIRDLGMDELEEKLFENPDVGPFKPEVVQILKRLQIQVNCMGRLLQAEPPRHLEDSELEFSTFYPADTGRLPVNRYGMMFINFREIGHGHPLQVYSTDELTQIRARFVLAEEQRQQDQI